MKRITLKFIPGVFLAVIFLLSSCTSAYKVTKSEGTMVAIDSTWDVNPDAEAVALLAPYKAKVDSIMYRVVGTAEMSMDKGAPESLLSNLVADIIQLSRLDESNSEVPFEEVDLYELAEDVRNNLRHPAGKKNIFLELAGSAEKIKGVRHVLYEMLFNIADNAVRYTEQNGHVRIIVGNRKGHPFYCVADDGIGIPKSEQGRIFERFYRVDKSHSRQTGGTGQERIFERFYRVDKSHSRETGGTGLGLSIVKHGATLHHAQINVESEQGVGTRMEIVFPENTSDRK